MKLSQTTQVIEVMRQLGGYATLCKLNSTLDFTSWKTRTPEASVRRIFKTVLFFSRLDLVYGL